MDIVKQARGRDWRSWAEWYASISNLGIRAVSGDDKLRLC